PLRVAFFKVNSSVTVSVAKKELGVKRPSHRPTLIKVIAGRRPGHRLAKPRSSDEGAVLKSTLVRFTH
ncbi:hypothetical protein, partial [Pelagicoccus mobilis]|uniref:hypothetical protein n=1 Tax=Pelagicoccus mobilis TaxID=415221 RepID=UPI001F265C18